MTAVASTRKTAQPGVIISTTHAICGLKQLQLLALYLTLSGCASIGDSFTNFMGGEDNSKPPTPLQDIVERTEVNKLWDRNTGAGSAEQYLKLIPIYHEDKLFVADNNGKIKAIDAATGKILWDTNTKTPITGGPGVGGNMVIVGTGKAEVIALSADTGEITWRYRVTSEVLAAPQVAANVVVVRTIDGNIFGLDATDGSRLWIYDRTVPALTLRGTSTPVIVDGLVIAGLDDGRLTAIELLTGKPVWEARIALGSGRSELDRMVDIDAEPVIKDGVIYSATFQGRIAALDLASGQILWTRDISSYAGLCVDETAVYVTDDNSEIWALDRLSGNSIWKQEQLNARAVTAPENTGAMVAVGDLEGYVHWLDKATGDIVARQRVAKTPIIAPPIAVDNTLFSYGSDGTLAAYSAGQVSPALPVEEPALATESKDEESLEEIQQRLDQLAIELQGEDAEIAPEVEAEDGQQEETTGNNEEEEEKGFFGRIVDYVIFGD